MIHGGVLRFIAEGTFPVDNSLAPRNISMAGLMLRALDGRPEMWPWITQYTRNLFETWVASRVTYPGLYYGARDPGYMLLHAANLARVHPDASVRQEFKAKVLKRCTQSTTTHELHVPMAHGEGSRRLLDR